jgi:hypothetical protein
MFKKINFIFFLFFTLLFINAQDNRKKIIVTNDKIGFEMSLSEIFSPLNNDALIQKIKKAETILKNLNEVEYDINDLGNVEMFKIDDNNLFGISIQEYDEKINGDYVNAVNIKNEQVYNLFKQNFPKAVIERQTLKESINGLEFLKYYQKVDLSIKKTIYNINYNKLFDNNIELIILMSFDDKKKGELMMNAFINSRFKPEKK